MYRTIAVSAALLLFAAAVGGCDEDPSPTQKPDPTSELKASGNMDSGETGRITVSTEVFGSQGEPVELVFAFRKRPGFTTWDWCLGCEMGEGDLPEMDDVEIIAGGSGTVSFDDQGDVVSWLDTDGSAKVWFRNPSASDGVVSFPIDPFGSNQIPALTSRAEPSTLALIQQ